MWPDVNSHLFLRPGPILTHDKDFIWVCQVLDLFKTIPLGWVLKYLELYKLHN